MAVAAKPRDVSQLFSNLWAVPGFFDRVLFPVLLDLTNSISLNFTLKNLSTTRTPLATMGRFETRIAPTSETPTTILLMHDKLSCRGLSYSAKQIKLHHKRTLKFGIFVFKLDFGAEKRTPLSLQYDRKSCAWML